MQKEKKHGGKEILNPWRKRNSDARYQSTKRKNLTQKNSKQNKRPKVEDMIVALTKQPLDSPFNFNFYPASKHDPVTAQETVHDKPRTK